MIKLIDLLREIKVNKPGKIQTHDSSTIPGDKVIKVDGKEYPIDFDLDNLFIGLSRKNSEKYNKIVELLKNKGIPFDEILEMGDYYSAKIKDGKKYFELDIWNL